jgi:TolA-binding protein
MGAVTYPNEAVTQELTSNFVPVKVESAKAPELARRMGIRWLPGLVVVDHDGRPAHAITGFLPPDDLLTELRFGRGIALMAAKRYDEAHRLFAEVGDSKVERAPEALYWLGVSRFRQTKDFGSSVAAPWGEIVSRFGASQWARKVGYAVQALAAQGR